MPESVVKQVITSKQVGDTQVVEEQVSSASSEDVAVQNEHTIQKSTQIFWYLAHIITVLLGLRFVFLLLGANATGIARLIYDLSEIFVLPFRGIFSTARMGESFFDSAALLGIVMYYLLALIVTQAFQLFSRKTTV